MSKAVRTALHSSHVVACLPCRKRVVCLRDWTLGLLRRLGMTGRSSKTALTINLPLSSPSHLALETSPSVLSQNSWLSHPGLYQYHRIASSLLISPHSLPPRLPPPPPPPSPSSSVSYGGPRSARAPRRAPRPPGQLLRLAGDPRLLLPCLVDHVPRGLARALRRRRPRTARCRRPALLRESESP